ncbi:MAG: GNAT family N-acetyltransferase [Thermoanaerobaculia bacterium]
MPFGWEGEKVRLTPLDKAKHLDNALAWINDPEVTAWTLMGDWPMTRLAEEDFFDRAMRETEKALHFAVETLAGDHIGFSSLVQIDWRQGVATTGTLLGRRDLWGQGYGSDAARLRTRHAFEVLGLRMLLSEVMADNAGSLKMLQKAGYREAGRIPRRMWKRGAFRDVVMMVLERE